MNQDEDSDGGVIKRGLYFKVYCWERKGERHRFVVPAISVFVVGAPTRIKSPSVVKREDGPIS